MPISANSRGAPGTSSSLALKLSESAVSETLDALVVGGGPAGCAAAHALATAGLSVTLIERGTLRRDKPCGDMFMPSAVDALHRLGLDGTRLLDAGGVSFTGIDLFGERGRLWTVSYPEGSVWMIPRGLVDQALRDCLPPLVRVVYNTTITEIVAEGGGRLEARSQWVQGTQSSRRFRCRGVVLACGAQDPLSARWGISGERLIAPSISAYTRNPDLKLPGFEFCKPCRPGYRWLFPTRQDQCNIGICSLAKLPGATLKSLGNELLDAYNLPRDVRWRGGVGSLWSGRGERWHHPAGIVSCGDAAGLVDPINGEGLSAALHSGEAAGRALGAFLLAPANPVYLQKYSKWVKGEFSTRYGISSLRTAWGQLAGAGFADPPTMPFPTHASSR